MTYSVSTSVSCSIPEHPLVHDLIDHIEDASKAVYGFVKGYFKPDISMQRTIDLMGISRGVGSNVHCESKANLAQIRAEIDAINHQMLMSNAHVETLRQALELSRDAHKLLQTRHTELLNRANKAVERKGHFVKLPQEIIAHIASILYWSENHGWCWPLSPSQAQAHFKWVTTVYRPASETLHFQNDIQSKLRLMKGRLAVLSDSGRLLTVHYHAADKYYYSDPHDVRNCVTQQTVLSTIHRWRELYLGDNFHQDYCDNLNHSVTGLPALTHLSVCHGTISHNSEPLPTWWGVFVERFGRVGSSSPVLRSADVPLGYLTTSGGLFSNVTRLRIYLPTNQSPAKISSALLYMHHLIILELQFRFFNEAIDATEDMKGVIKVPSLKEITIRGIAADSPALNISVAAFQCENLEVFHAELFDPNSSPRREEIVNLLISVHDSFPVLKELFCHILRPTPCNSWVRTSRLDQHL